MGLGEIGTQPIAAARANGSQAAAMLFSITPRVSEEKTNQLVVRVMPLKSKW